MLTLLLVWGGAAILNVMLFAAVALAHDGRVVFTTWVRGGLTVMGLLGPVGTLLTAAFLWRLVAEVALLTAPNALQCKQPAEAGCFVSMSRLGAG
jgi:hypothetical protein